MFLTRILIAASFLAGVLCRAQIPDGAIAVYDFNNSNSFDRVSGKGAQIHSAFFTEDRFGNSESAIYFHGNKFSFAKLPPSVLSREKGSVSLWFSMHGIMGLGEGVDSNPLFSIRSHSGKDCNDGIYIGVDMNTIRINGATLNSCSEGISLYSKFPITMNKWHHVVLCYDDSHLALYCDGDFQFSMPRGFRTRLLETDSILLGMRSSAANERYFLGCIDDIISYDRVLTGAEVENLFHAPDHNWRNVVLKWSLLGLSLVFTVILVVYLIRYRVRILVLREKKKDILQKKMLELENKVLSAQMDPHFVFNSLNTIQQLIITGDNDSARHYLSQFAKLIRKILETNTRESVTLKEEITICEKYLEIESLRFSQVFTFQIKVDPLLNVEEVRMPHFLLQPMIENAIWHGLLQKDGPKELVISFTRHDQDTLYCVVEDNGIGRSAAAKSKQTSVNGKNRRSLAIKFIDQRLQLFCRLRGSSYFMKITDKQDEQGKSTGTRVELYVPIIHAEQYETSHYN